MQCWLIPSEQEVIEFAGIVALTAQTSTASSVYHAGTQTISFTRHRFPPEFIYHAVWLNERFTLSYRDVEDLLAEGAPPINQRAWSMRRGGPPTSKQETFCGLS